jgi:hypothetical protein
MPTARHSATKTPGAERLHAKIEAARRRVEMESPFSPSWDAAMAALEDADRELWRYEQSMAATA